MSMVQSSIEVDLPVRSVYNQWTQFEEFPNFMEGIESVEQITDETLHWCAQIAGVRREWDARITEQEPDVVISWESIGEVRNSGRVMFEELEPMRTRITLHMEFEPEGFAEKAADTLNIVQRRVEGDLERFKTYLEERGAESGEWRGEIQDGRTVKLDEEARRIDLSADGARTEHAEYPTQTPAVPPPPRQR